MAYTTTRLVNATPKTRTVPYCSLAKGDKFLFPAGIGGRNLYMKQSDCTAICLLDGSSLVISRGGLEVVPVTEVNISFQEGVSS